MKRAVIIPALLALAACTTLPQVVTRSDDMFDVRFDAAAQTTAEVDATANAHCAGDVATYVSQRDGFEGLAYRTYRCAARQQQPRTVSVPAGPNAEDIARRECGAPVRPETVSHDSNVIIFRCLRER